MNIGTGTPVSILDLARILRQLIQPAIEPVVTGQARVGDIRHCTADIQRAVVDLAVFPAGGAYRWIETIGR